MIIDITNSYEYGQWIAEVITESEIRLTLMPDDKCIFQIENNETGEMIYGIVQLLMQCGSNSFFIPIKNASVAER